METSTAPSKRSVKHWYLPMILGIIFIVLGFWIFRTPIEFFITLSIFFGLTFLITGFLEIIYAISNRNEAQNWGWSLAGGIIDLLIGILLVARPQISMLILPFFIGFGVLFRSIMSIGWSIDLKKQGVADWGWLLITGILGAVLAFILLWNPVFAGLTIAFYAALSFIVIGISQIYFSIRLRRLR